MNVGRFGSGGGQGERGRSWVRRQGRSSEIWREAGGWWNEYDKPGLRDRGMGEGYVYIMKNEAFGDLLKIGKTSSHPEKRAKELSSHTGSPYPFKVVFFDKFDRYSELERMIHNRLQAVRFKKEFFKVDPMTAILTLKKCKLEMCGKQIDDLEILNRDEYLNMHRQVDSIAKRNLISRGYAETLFKLGDSWFRNREKAGLPVPPYVSKKSKGTKHFNYKYDFDELSNWFKANPDTLPDQTDRRTDHECL